MQHLDAVRSPVEGQVRTWQTGSLGYRKERWIRKGCCECERKGREREEEKGVREREKRQECTDY